MNTYFFPKTLNFTYCSDIEDEEIVIQLPNSFAPKTVSKVTNGRSQSTTGLADEIGKNGCLRVRKSIEMKKPSNSSPSKPGQSTCDSDTQWDTSDSDSEGEVFNMSEEELIISQENYRIIVEKWYALVWETNESKFKPFSSPKLLRDRLYEIKRLKRADRNKDSFFTEFDFSSESTIRNGFESQSQSSKRPWSNLYSSKRRCISRKY